MGGKIFVTGGSGFIGSHFVRTALNKGYRVLNYDALTYASTEQTLADVAGHPNYIFFHGRVESKDQVDFAFRHFEPDHVVHFAAESHVDRSIDNPEPFLDTNIYGTFSLLEVMKKHSPQESQRRRKFIHISTDEVYGSHEGHAVQEGEAYQPSSPYSASKAAADHMVRAYETTYNQPAMIVNCTNNYGPYQFPEKLIPHMILNALHGKPLTLYGDGQHQRNWLYVGDHVDAILKLLEAPTEKGTYHVGGTGTVSNIEIVQQICTYLDANGPNLNHGSYHDLITFITDRPGHDRCYDLDTTLIKDKVNWQAQTPLSEGLAKTCAWYMENEAWWRHLCDQGYQLNRLGLGQAKSA